MAQHEGEMNYIWLIHGGDRNSWVWHYWRIYFEAYCKLPPNLPTYFLTENKAVPKEWAPITPFTTGKCEFSQQLLTFLRSVTAKYVLYSMDDFFLQGQPDFNKIQQIAEWMESYNAVNVKLFDNKHTEDARRDNPANRFGIHDYEYWRPYAISCQPSLWNREFLISRLRPTENGWQFEIDGSNRMIQNKISTHVYTDPYVFPYKEGMRRGKIRPGSEHLFDKANLPKKAT